MAPILDSIFETLIVVGTAIAVGCVATIVIFTLIAAALESGEYLRNTLIRLLG